MFTKASLERGFPTPTRAQFDATSGPDGAFFLGDPDSVAAKLQRISEQLGGVDRVSLQMTNTRLAHTDLLRGIELLGTEVAPRVADV
jgi:alkanesulfonate monooxygenase SsuD/methylene tetrahydromethanopterin reductase-like flavin-dependent oxidoreductase (luciferase family)